MKIAIFQYKLFGINTYVVVDPETKDCAVVDPGMSDKEEEKAIENFINRNNLRLTQVINTHLHIDHVAGNNFLKQKYGVEAYANEKDNFLAKNIKAQAQMFGLGDNFEDIVIDKNLNPGDIIKIGKEELEVLEVPGHSKGSIALYDKKDGFVITGDALFNGSIGRTDLPGGDYKELLSNIKNNLFNLPDETVVYPGHGPSTTIGNEKRTNPFFH